ncbi:MAG: GlsB/YeaQ/YmgE family stress response membrane protein [Planctomycetaceae bacterium]|jgi:uncharacterized membrane protein YeaQ/YmgE (transglycosylase-associated protein family)|nr:GlsB/YeaQ/YmgE family stress response membrane protein [Planctomycetaceae bacterium]
MEFSPQVQTWVNVILLWVGFGAVVGLAARMVLPSGEPKNYFGTLVIGIIGSCAGPFLVSHFLKPEHFHPFGPAGFFVSVAAAIVLLMLYRGIIPILYRSSPRQ